MMYQGKTYKGMNKVFEEALEIAKNRPEEAEDFLISYAECILKENPNCRTMDEAISIAKSNLGYFSGYCSPDIVDLMYKTYNTKHPLFDLV